MNRFFNPRTPWSELERRLSGRPDPKAPGVGPRAPEQDPGPVSVGPGGSDGPSRYAGADGSDAPAFSRPDRYRDRDQDR